MLICLPLRQVSRADAVEEVVVALIALAGNAVLLADLVDVVRLQVDALFVERFFTEKCYNYHFGHF
jgi:hypothetical protein